MRAFSRRQIMPLTVGAATALAIRAHAAGPIDETGFVRIGGIEQWIAIQGRDAANPGILFLHGGPGEAQSPFLSQFLPWQREFTVANWDQRGAGKTFGRNGAATPDMTLDRLVDDAIAVAEHVRARLGQKKLILVGHSVGSVLGVHALKKRPDLFHAFVGSGQVVSFRASVDSALPYARAQAEATNDQAAIKAMDDAAALPFPRNYIGGWSSARKFLWPAADLPYTNMIRDYTNPRGAPSEDVAAWNGGANFSGQLARFLMPDDLRTLGLEMPVPFFVVQGREDHISGVAPARAWTEEIRAPAKAFVAIEGGHFACFTNPDAFVAALRQHARPLAM
jgi:pimeloyl-ACP methyl ester carboxylesterase